MSPLDSPVKIRQGEELDIDAVDRFLKSSDLSLSGRPEILQFRGGSSNLTYQIAYPDRRVILRRPPFGHRAGAAHDMLREARILEALKPVYPYVPAVIATCQDDSVLGCPFYVMARIDGIILRKDLPAGLTLGAAEARRVCLTMIDRLIELHQIDHRAAGLDHLGKGEGYVRRQIEGWSERYLKAFTADSASFQIVMAWLRAEMPADAANRLIHNDYRFDNVVLDADNRDRVIGVLDWEMATIGDPLMDLGNTLAYWVEAGDPPPLQAMRLQPTHLPGMLTRQEVVAYYGEKTGYAVDRFDYYLVYGLFRLAGIIQQIYFRFRQGHARNPEFATFGALTHVLEKRCLALIGQRIT